MIPNLNAALNDQFGFAAFRAGQREAMNATLAARDVLVVMPTGSGKSLCYQLPALLLPHTTLVISPLVALMKDQVDALIARNKPATFINSTLSVDEQRARLSVLARGWYKIVYVAPERLHNTEFLAAIAQTRVSLVAVDEAHCISQWGHDFRPDYMHIREFAAQVNRPPVLALTATATPQVQEDIIARLGLAHPERIVTGFNRPNIALRVQYTPTEEDKLRGLAEILHETDGSLIIYTGTRRETEEVSEFCNEVVKIPAAFYHAGMDDGERTRVQDDFMRDDVRVIVATNAFGMGVDKPDIRAVIHYALPSTIEAYYQEVGRAGRDGMPARGILLYSPKDRALQEWFIENDAPDQHQVLHLHHLLARAAASAPAWLSPTELQRQTGMNDTKLRVALQQLEQANTLRRIGDFHGKVGVELISNTPPDLTACAADSKRLHKHKRVLLEHIIEYAETNACRRRFILDYFGDGGAADAPDCCDNHAASTASPTRRAESEDEWIPLVVLETVQTVKNSVGREKIAQILKGSHARDITQFGYTRHKFYGKLADITQRQIGYIIEDLIRHGYLKTIGGEYPVLALTPQGDLVLQNRAAIGLKLMMLPSTGKRADRKAARQVGGSVEYTLALIQQGKLPDEIARTRSLAISTIYGHIERLIKEGRISGEQVVPPDVRTQIVAGMAQWNGQWLSELKALLPESISYDQIRCVVAAHRAKPIELPNDAEPAHDAVADFLSRPHPRLLHGPWRAGYALDFHSKFAGAQNIRTDLGDLVYRFKYGGEESLGETLATRLADFICAHPELQANIVLPIPSTLQDRAYDPVPLLARLLAARLPIAMDETALVKARTTAPQKEMVNLAQKTSNVAGAFRITNADAIHGKRVLLLDDLFDSGATLAEATRTLMNAGAHEVYVLTITRTIHAE